MSGIWILVGLVILAGYGYYMYKQGFDNGIVEGVMGFMVRMYKDKRIDRAYIMKNIPTLTADEFEEIFHGD